MKPVTFSIDPKSFLLGALAVGGLLTLANFTPRADTNRQPDPAILDTRRFQVVTGERETIILDTQTGRFVVSPGYLGQPRWIKGDFEELQGRDRR